MYKSLSENRCCFQRDDGELKVQEADVVGDFFLPPDQESPGAVEPRMSAFDFPATGFAATALGLRGLVGLPWDMRCVTSPANFMINRIASIAFVETEMLRLLGRRLRTFDRDGVERGRDQ